MSQDYHKCFSLSNKYAFLQILLRMCAELSAHMTVYARLGLRNLLSVENFSALAPAYHPAWTEKSAVCRQFICPRTSISPGLGREICCL